MLFYSSRSIALFFFLGGSVWGSTTHVPNEAEGYWLRRRTQGENYVSMTVQTAPSDDFGDHLDKNSTILFSASEEEETRKDYSETVEERTESPEARTDGEIFPSELNVSTKFFRTTSQEDHSETLEARPDIDEISPPETSTSTKFFRTTSPEDDFRTRRGIVLVDDDFNVSPDPGVNQGWSDGGRNEDAKRPKASTTTHHEGSGQDEPSPTPDENTFPEGSGDEPTESWDLDLCLNSTCDLWDMAVFPRHGDIVPVGTNVSLSCVQSNDSLDALRWYKYDEDGNPLLQADVARESELTFAIERSKTEHSGKYVCVRGTAVTGSCCHRTLHVKVYEVPNYRYHLVVIGVVTAVCLFGCLLLGVCRNYKTKKYEVQLELQHMESDCVFKL